MSVYRCDECDVQKDNDIECVFDINDKQLCQSCVDDEVDLSKPIKEEKDESIQESKTDEVDVQEQTTTSKEVGDENKKVEKEEMSKKVRSQEELIMENINLNMKIVTYEFKCKGLEYEVKTLKEKLNERNN